MYGTNGLPKDWVEYIGDNIVSISLITGMRAAKFPKTCTELTERVIALAPHTVQSRLDWTYSNNKYVLVRFADEEYVIKAGDKVEAVNDVVIEVKFDGRVYRGYIHIPLMG